MPALEAIRSNQTKKIPWYIHLFAVFLLDVLLIYYLMPAKVLLCIPLATALWWLTWEDYTKKEVDIRVCGIFFLIGLIIHRDTMLFNLYIGLLGFLIPHVIHEGLARIEASSSAEGKMDYHNPYPEADIDKAPPYIPMFTGSLMVVLLYYLLGLPMSDSFYETVFAPMPIAVLPWMFWILPGFLALLSIYFWNRNKNALKNGNNVVYRGFGDGDIYFVGVMIGVLGFFTTLLTVFVSMFVALIMIRRWKNTKRREPI